MSSTTHTIDQPAAIPIVSQLLPPDLRRALMEAHQWPRHCSDYEVSRIERIDNLTDEAARRGLVRRRTDDTMQQRWAADKAAAEARTGLAMTGEVL